MPLIVKTQGNRVCSLLSGVRFASRQLEERKRGKEPFVETDTVSDVRAQPAVWQSRDTPRDETRSARARVVVVVVAGTRVLEDPPEIFTVTGIP